MPLISQRMYSDSSRCFAAASSLSVTGRRSKTRDISGETCTSSPRMRRCRSVRRRAGRVKARRSPAKGGAFLLIVHKGIREFFFLCHRPWPTPALRRQRQRIPGPAAQQKHSTAAQHRGPYPYSPPVPAHDAKRSRFHARSENLRALEKANDAFRFRHGREGSAGGTAFPLITAGIPNPQLDKIIFRE